MNIDSIKLDSYGKILISSYEVEDSMKIIEHFVRKELVIEGSYTHDHISFLDRKHSHHYEIFLNEDGNYNLLIKKYSLLDKNPLECNIDNCLIKLNILREHVINLLNNTSLIVDKCESIYQLKNKLFEYGYKINKVGIHQIGLCLIIEKYNKNFLLQFHKFNKKKYYDTSQ